MDLKDFTDMGSNIGRRVNDAINNNNFDHLDKDIKREFNQVFGGNQENNQFGGLNGKLYREPENTSNYNQTFHQSPQKTYRKMQTTKSNVPVNIPVASRVPGKVSSVIMMASGYLMTGIFGISAIVLAVLSATVSMVGTIPANIIGAIAGGFVVPFIAGVILALVGTKRYGRISRFKQYLTILAGAKFAAIKDMAKRIGKKPRFVFKDLRTMIENGFFLEGHIDDQRTCFMGTNEIYQQYLLARDSASSSEQQEEASQESEKTSSEIEQIIAEGEDYIKAIREANDAIYDKEISEKLYKMESTAGKIFDYVRQRPDQSGQLRRFTSYYMPMTEKLFKAYIDLDQQTIRGENITKAKNEIANTLDTINEAFEKLFDSMYVDVAMDVSSDIAVLKTLFAQEGLAGDEMNGGKRK